uniref:Putative myosin heavy chain b ixodes scapularis myosin heavy chain b n=1 Tax=Amblyomma triste TaxID=251400 RepID=A0A023GP30_AMBTT
MLRETGENGRGVACQRTSLAGKRSPNAKELDSLKASQPGETACVQSTCKSCDDLKETVQRLSTEKDDLTTKNNFLARKLNEVLEKLEDSEETISALKQSEAELRTRTEKLSFVNEGLKNLVDAVKDEATILRQQVLIMDKEVKSSHELLEQKKMQCKGLEDQLVKLRSKCCESINAGAIKDREIEKLTSLVRLARRKLFSKTSSMHQADGSLEESSKNSSDNNITDEALLKMLSSEEIEDSGIPAKPTSRTESSNCELFEHCLRYLGSAMLHHESLIDKANAKVRDIVSTSHSINLQLHVMQEVLSMQHAKEDGGSAERDPSVTKEVTGPSEELVPPRIEGCDFVTSLFETMCRNHSKMQSLMQSESQLEKELADCRELNRLLSSKVHEQERKLCGFVQELDRTKTLLAGMEQTHHKLQTAKAVMRYELQEKKSLLHNLRQQLESTRENCVKVMRSNAESEIEWRSLREEFQSRKKQDSQDSGVSDNGQSTREQTPSSSEDCSERDDPESVEDDDRSDSVEDIPDEGAQFIPEQVADFEGKYRARTQRLEYLEQQCQILYNSLVRSSERSNSLQRRLHSLLEAGGSSGNTEAAAQPVPAENASSIPEESDDSGSCEGVVEEDCDAASDDVSSFCGEDSDDVAVGALPEIRKRTLDTIVGRVKLERSQSEEVISNLRATIAQLQTANERLRQQVSNLVEEKAQREKEMRQRASGMLRTERSLKNVQMQEISRERGELLQRNKELEQQLEQKDIQINRMDANRRQSVEKQQMLEKNSSSSPKG